MRSATSTRVTFITAEIGSTHDGSVGIARQSIRVAASCGVDAVKFQLHLAAAESTRDAPAPSFFDGESRFEYFQRTAFSPEGWKTLAACARSEAVGFVVSPFSTEAVELLERIGIDRYKIPSGEVTNLPLLAEVARTQKPVLLSSGMSDWGELDAAVDTICRINTQLTVLQCTSSYPCPVEQVGLNVMGEMRSRYRLPVGLSDHTLTNYASFAAAALGADVIEKHFTLSRHLYGSDAAHSVELAQFRDLVAGIRAIETMRAADLDKDALGRFAEMRRVFQKSIVAAVDIPVGALISASMLGVKKPGTGLNPARLGDVIGSRARRAIAADHVLVEEDVELIREAKDPDIRRKSR